MIDGRPVDRDRADAEDDRARSVISASERPCRDQQHGENGHAP